MLARSRFMLVLVVGGLLAVLSFSLQYLHSSMTDVVLKKETQEMERKRPYIENGKKRSDE